MYEQAASAVRCDMVLHRAFVPDIQNMKCNTSPPQGVDTKKTIVNWLGRPDVSHLFCTRNIVLGFTCRRLAVACWHVKGSTGLARHKHVQTFLLLWACSPLASSPVGCGNHRAKLFYKAGAIRGSTHEACSQPHHFPGGSLCATVRARVCTTPESE